MAKLGNYQVVKLLGSTELTMLYQAQHPYLGKNLVIEAAQATGEKEDIHQRLEFLAKLLGRLQHPGILPIADAFTDEKMMYLVFSWAEDLTNLEAIVKREQKCSTDEALGWILQAAEVLLYLKQQGVVHQNLRLNNMLWSKDHFYIGGFTMANTLKDPFGEERGNLEDACYASPEWLLRDPICVEQDIWALGVCFYRLLTGEYPFMGDEQKEIGEYILEGKYRPIQERLPDLSSTIAELIAQMLARNKNERPTIEKVIEVVENELYQKPLDSIFVAMPFHPQFNRIYQTIKNVCQLCRLRPIRVDENILPANIWQDIENGIANSAFIIGDLSPVPGPGQTNPNVAFEVGIAYNQQKPTVLLTQDINALPFDFKQQRAHAYSNDEDSLKKLEKELVEVFQTVLKNQK